MQSQTAIIAGGSSFYGLCAAEGCTLSLYSEGNSVNKNSIKYVSLCDEVFTVPDGVLKNMTIYSPCSMIITLLSPDSNSYLTRCETNKKMNDYNCLVAIEEEATELSQDEMEVVPLAIMHKSKPIVGGLILPDPSELIPFLMEKYK